MIVGVPVKVQPVSENILTNELVQDVQVQTAGILYAFVYAQVCVVLSFILLHWINIPEISVTLFVFHFEISGNWANDEHWPNNY